MRHTCAHHESLDAACDLDPTFKPARYHCEPDQGNEYVHVQDKRQHDDTNRNSILTTFLCKGVPMRQEARSFVFTAR